MRKCYTGEHVIGILKEYEGGKKAADIVREYGISERPFYCWKSKYGGMELHEAKVLNNWRMKTAA